MACVNQLKLKVSYILIWLSSWSIWLWILIIIYVYAGKIYDLGGQVLAASSAPVIFHLAKETGCTLEEMNSHKLAVIDSSSGKYQDVKVADDYVSVMSLTLQIQVSINTFCLS